MTPPPSSKILYPRRYCVSFDGFCKGDTATFLYRCTVHYECDGGLRESKGRLLSESPGCLAECHSGTVLSSIFILLTTCIGAGTLSLPYAFSKGGIFVFSAIFFLIMVMLCAITLDYKFIELYLIICYDSTQDAIHNETSLYWDLGNCLLYRGCP